MSIYVVNITSASVSLTVYSNPQNVITLRPGQLVNTDTIGQYNIDLLREYARDGIIALVDSATNPEVVGSGGLATIEYADSHIAGKLVDLTGRNTNSVVLYDTTAQRYIHYPFSSIASSTPARVTITTPPQTVIMGTPVDIQVVIPNLRLYGVTVSVPGIPVNQRLSVELFGDAARTSRQYSATFTDMLPVDTSQAWMYRNLDGLLVMNMRLTNLAAINLTNISVTVVAEPF